MNTWAKRFLANAWVGEGIGVSANNETYSDERKERESGMRCHVE